MRHLSAVLQVTDGILISRTIFVSAPNDLQFCAERFAVLRRTKNGIQTDLRLTWVERWQIESLGRIRFVLKGSRDVMKGERCFYGKAWGREKGMERERIVKRTVRRRAGAIYAKKEAGGLEVAGTWNEDTRNGQPLPGVTSENFISRKCPKGLPHIQKKTTFATSHRPP